MNKEGKEVTETSDVLKCQTIFYKKLYKAVGIDDSISIHLILGDNESKLSDKESQELKGEISQLIRFARASSNLNDFNYRNKALTAKLLRQGYRYFKLRKAFSKFYRRHSALLEKNIASV